MNIIHGTRIFAGNNELLSLSSFPSGALLKRVNRRRKTYGCPLEAQLRPTPQTSEWLPLETVFGKSLITCGIRPPGSPDMNPSDFYFCGRLKDNLLEYFELYSKEIANI